MCMNKQRNKYVPKKIAFDTDMHLIMKNTIFTGLAGLTVKNFFNVFLMSAVLLFSSLLLHIYWDEPFYLFVAFCLSCVSVCVCVKYGKKTRQARDKKEVR